MLATPISAVDDEIHCYTIRLPAMFDVIIFAAAAAYETIRQRHCCMPPPHYFFYAGFAAAAMLMLLLYMRIIAAPRAAYAMLRRCARASAAAPFVCFTFIATLTLRACLPATLLHTRYIVAMPCRHVELLISAYTLLPAAADSIFRCRQRVILLFSALLMLLIAPRCHADCRRYAMPALFRHA